MQGIRDVLRVIHVTHQPIPYGIGTFLVNLLSCQKSRFADLSVAIAFNADGPLMTTYEGIGVPVHCLGLSTARDPRVFGRLRKIFRGYDIVNLHSYSPWAFLAAKLTGKKVVYTFHGAFGVRNGRLNAVRKMYHRGLVNRHCDKITFASESAFSIYEAKVGAGPEHGKVEIFPYGVSLKRIVPARDSMSVRHELGLTGCFVVGTVARMDPVKKIERLIDAFALLPREDTFKLVIVGAGDSHYENMLRKQVQHHQLDDCVLFLGYRPDAIDIMGALDMFVLPSRGETFGLALLEAMALGIPSAVFQDAGGPIDILGDSGFVVASPDELSKAIMALQEDSALRQTISRNVHLRSRRFDITYAADNLYRVYKSL